MPTNLDDLTRIPSYIDDAGNFPNRDSEILQQLNHSLESSKAFLRSNKMWPVIEINRDILHGDDKILGTLSNEGRIVINKLRRQGRELVGNAANIKPNFQIRTPKSDDSASNKAATYEELKDHCWRDRFYDRTVKEAVHEAGCGIGYLFTWPDKDPNTGKVEIIPHAKSYKEVFPYQMGPDNDLDKAYQVHVWCEMPLSEFREKFPLYANSINPTRNAPTYLGKKYRRAVNKVKGLRGMLQRGAEAKADSIKEASFPMVDVFYTFTRDNTINTTGKSIKMGTLVSGDLAGHDSYEVPAHDVSKTNIEDCKLFPFRRLTIWTHGRILQDGPPKWITFNLPVSELRFERIPKELLGVPITNDGRSLEDAINEMLNSIYTRIRARAKFPIGVDESLPVKVKTLLQRKGLLALVGKALVMNFRAANKPVQALFDKDLFGIDQHEFVVVKDLMTLQDYVTGTNDFANLQRKNQLPAADTVEALVQNLGVLSVDHEREIALGIAKFGRIWLQFAPQVYTLKKRITIIGANAVDIKDMDYDPESLIPKLDPGRPQLESGVPDPAYKPYWKRLKEHLERFNLVAQPGSMQERQSMTNKLTLLQMLKSGVPISTRKLYDTFIGDGEYDKVNNQWEEEQERNAKLAARIRKEVEAIAGSGQSPEGGGLLQQVMQALEQQNTMHEGRPSSNNSSPRAEIKTDEDGTKRTAMATN